MWRKPDDARAAGAREEVLSGEAADALVAATPRRPGAPLTVEEVLALAAAIAGEADPTARAARIRGEILPGLAGMDPLIAASIIKEVAKTLGVPVGDLRDAVRKARVPDVTAPGGGVEIEDARELAGILTLDCGTVYAVARRTLQTRGGTVRALSVLTWDGREARILDGTADAPVPALPDGMVIALRPGDLPERCPTLAALRRFAAGERVPGPEVFGRVQRVIGHFLDLGTFPGGQDAAELVLTAWALSAWWQRPARLVASYLQVTGPKGSGKSRALAVAAEVVLAGELVLSSTSNAALRDLCSAGACLLLDEAEDVARSRPQGEAGQDRRGLLLGGTRPGTSWALKVATPDGRWETCRIPVHGPRGFASIGTPEAVLGSRALRIPMVRTADPARARRDPALDGDWPAGETRASLRDALTLWALGSLRDAPKWYSVARERLPVFGRDAEPWLPLAAVCLAVDACDGGDRTARLIEAIKGTAHDDTPDREREVLAAVARLWESGTLAPGPGGTRTVPVAAVAEVLDGEGDDEADAPDDDARRRHARIRAVVGRTLRGLRIGRVGKLHGGRSAVYVEAATLRERLEAYGVGIPRDLTPTTLTRLTPTRDSAIFGPSPGSGRGEGCESGATPHGSMSGEGGGGASGGDAGDREFSSSDHSPAVRAGRFRL